jgi:hypothetical protein
MSAMILSDAFNKFYHYIHIFQANHIDKGNFDRLFYAPFTVFTINNDTLTLQTLDDVVAFYDKVRNVVYPAICAPNEFQFFRLNQLVYTALSSSTIQIAQQYVWHTAPGEIPRFVEAFSYLVKHIGDVDGWRICGLIEMHSDYFPDNWTPISIPDNWQYSN